MIVKVRKSVLKLAEGLRSAAKSNPNLATYVMHGFLFDTVINLYKPFASKFIERLGGDEFYISLYNSLPGLVAVCALIPGALFIARFKRTKLVTAVFFILSRLFIMLLAFVPFFPKELQPMLFVATISIMNFPDSISQTSLQSFLGSIFDGHSRAQAIALRNKFGNLFVMAITLLTGTLISTVPKTPDGVIMFYQAFYIAAYVLSIIEVVVFLRFKERESPLAASGRPTVKTVALALKDRRFIAFLLGTLGFYVSWICGWSINSVYQIMYLGANEIWLALFSVGSGAVSFFSAGIWAKIIKKRGDSYSIMLACFAVFLNMLFISITPNLWLMLLVNAYSGFAVIGVNTSLFNGLLGATPEKNRVVYIGVFNTFINILLGLVPFLSLFLMNHFSIYVSMYFVVGMRAAAVIILFLVYLRSKKRSG